MRDSNGKIHLKLVEWFDISPWHMSVKDDAVHINNNTKSHTRCGYTVTGKLRNTIKEARHTVIPGNT